MRPMQYLIDWRLAVAKAMLQREAPQSVAAVNRSRLAMGSIRRICASDSQHRLLTADVFAASKNQPLGITARDLIDPEYRVF